MRLFGGLSFGLGRARLGVSRRGNLWAGVRGGKGPGYVGALGSVPMSKPERRRMAKREADWHALHFEVTDDGRVYVNLAGNRAELKLEDLRRVVQAADAARGTKGSTA